MIQASIAFILAIATSVMLNAQQDSVFRFSLEEAGNYAVDNYFMTKNARLDIESAKDRIWETTAIGLPQVSGGADYNYLPEIPTTSFPAMSLFNNLPQTNDYVTGEQIHNNLGIRYEEGQEIQLGVEHNINYNLMVTQLIFSGEYIVGLQASKTYLRLSEESYEKTRVELKQLVANSYYTILVLEKNEELLRESLSNLVDIYEDTKKMAGQGMIESTEADQIEINIKRTDNRLKSVQRQLEMMRKMLKYQLGLDLDVDLLLTDKLPSLITDNIIGEAQVPDFNLKEHIDYRLMNTEEMLNLLSLKREKSKYLPSLSAFYRFEDKLNKPEFDFTMRHMVGVSLSVPVFASGQKKARVDQARIELEKSQIKKDQESERLIMQVSQARFDYLNALEQYFNEKDNYELSSRILANTTKKYRQGMVSSMDLTLSNNQCIQAQISYSQAVLELLNAKVTLDKAYNNL